MVIFLIVLCVALAAWGQYWYDRCSRMADAIQFMIEEELDKQD